MGSGFRTNGRDGVSRRRNVVVSSETRSDASLPFEVAGFNVYSVSWTEFVRVSSWGPNEILSFFFFSETPNVERVSDPFNVKTGVGNHFKTYRIVVETSFFKFRETFFFFFFFFLSRTFPLTERIDILVKNHGTVVSD